jgi:hypothetical protein
MASLIVAGDTSGTVTLQAPAIAGSTVLTLPTTSGTIVTTAGGSTVPFALGSAASPSITFTGDTNTGIFSPGADTIGFAEGGVESMRLDSSGNLGLGVTSVSSNISGSARVLGICDPTNSNLASLRLGSGSSFASGNKMEVFSAAGSCGLFGQDNFPMVFSTNSTERMRIDSNGTVGIGVTPNTGWSPTLSKAIQIANLGASISSYTTSNTSGLFLQATTNAYYDGDWKYLITSGNPIAQYEQVNGLHAWKRAVSGTAGNTVTWLESMRITSDGALRVGTTAIVYSAGELVSMKATGSNYTLGLEASTGVCLAMNMAGQSSGTLVRFDSSGSNRGTISTNGSTVSYNTSSDYRLKENIAPMTGALAIVGQLKPCTYTWKESGLDSQGFIAHELAEVVPDAVTGEKDAVEMQSYEISPAVPATYDEEGNELTPAVEAVMGEREVPVYQGIDTSFLVATLTAAIQEQQAIITAMEARLTALENK